VQTVIVAPDHTQWYIHIRRGSSGRWIRTL